MNWAATHWHQQCLWNKTALLSGSYTNPLDLAARKFWMIWHYLYMLYVQQNAGYTFGDLRQSKLRRESHRITHVALSEKATSASQKKRTNLVGGRPTPLKNHGLRQLGWWHSQLFLESHSKFHGSSHHQAVIKKPFITIIKTTIKMV